MLFIKLNVFIQFTIQLVKNYGSEENSSHLPEDSEGSSLVSDDGDPSAKI